MCSCRVHCPQSSKIGRITTRLQGNIKPSQVPNTTSNSQRYQFNLYLLFPFALFFGPVNDSGSHSFTGSGGGAGDDFGLSSLSSIIRGTYGVFSSSSCAFAAAAAISSGLTCSPLLRRAAISGVTRSWRTLVWNPGARDASPASATNCC